MLLEEGRYDLWIMLVRRIIPQSLVDGPGNRFAVFLQGCNLRCAYCHNPETQPMESDDKDVVEMSIDQIMEQIRASKPFIRGITVSGGECMLQTEELTRLFQQCRSEGLNCLIDSNGTIDFALHPQLLAVTNGVMLDVKAWDDSLFHRLTSGHNHVVKKNLSFLANQGKLEEVRIVCLKTEVDVEADIQGVAQMLGEKKETTRLRLIRFRPQGVLGRLRDAQPPSNEEMLQWQNQALRAGFQNVIIT